MYLRFLTESRKMTSYTLPELVNYALRHPEVGAVNFNALYIVLQTIIKKCNLFEEQITCTPPAFEYSVSQMSQESSKEDENRILDLKNMEKLDSEKEFDESIKKINDIEMKINEILSEIDALKKSMEATQLQVREYEEKREKDYEEGKTLKREEFESAIEELGEAITILSLKLKNQIENAENERKEESLCKMSSALLEEKIEKLQKPIFDKLRKLTVMIRRLQIVFKEVIYPEACGVTKCVTCGRRAHLPVMKLIHHSSVNGNTESVSNHIKEKLDRLREEEKPPAAFDEGIKDHESDRYLTGDTQS